METHIYMTIQGRNGHKFLGGGYSGMSKSTEVQSFDAQTRIPIEAVTAQGSGTHTFFSSGGSQLYINRNFGPQPAPGQRVHKPIKILKEWGSASPRIYQALLSGEVLPHVRLQFVNTTPGGKDNVSGTVNLTNVTIVGLTRWPHHRPRKPSHTYEYEEVALTFEKIIITSSGKGKKGFTDDWNLGG